MLNIRLSRRGKKKQPVFRLIICEKTKDPWGKYLESLGYYNPRSKELSLKADRLNYWIEKGAQPSDSIWNILVEKGIVEGKKRTVTKISKKRLAKSEEAKLKEADNKKDQSFGQDSNAPTPEIKAEDVKQENNTKEEKKENAEPAK